MRQKKLSLKTALIWIFFSTFLISGGTFFLIQMIQKVYQKRGKDSRYNIQYLQLESNSDEPHMGEFFSEALGLSHDEPTNILHFNTKKAAKHLHTLDIIDEVSVSKILPDTIAIRYLRKEPFFFIGKLPKLCFRSQWTSLSVKTIFFSEKND